MNQKSKAEQFLIDRNFGGVKPWFDKEGTYYEIEPSVMQDFADKEVNTLLMVLKNNVKMMDIVNKKEVKSLIDSFRR